MGPTDGKMAGYHGEPEVTEDVLDTWNQFITQFETSFNDTQKSLKSPKPTEQFFHDMA